MEYSGTLIEELIAAVDRAHPADRQGQQDPAAHEPALREPQSNLNWRNLSGRFDV